MVGFTQYGGRIYVAEWWDWQKFGGLSNPLARLSNRLGKAVTLTNISNLSLYAFS